MTRTTWHLGAALAGTLMLVLAGCGKQQGAGEAAADAAGAVASPEGAALAYEHDVRIRVDAGKIAGRVKQLADACQSSRFGDCAVLQVSQEGGEYPSGSIRVRIAPKGVEPLIGLAGQGGELASRNTQAEDLAQQVADTALTKARLEKEHARLLAYQDRGGLAVADLLTITQRLSEIEAGVEQATREAAQQRRRIDTQLLTLQFETSSGQRSRSEIGEALRDSGGILSSSVAFLIRAAAALLPAAVVLVAVVWIALKLRRRRRARAAQSVE
ncbi:DUF4349 domain-containing protein [Stenotrophomonas rhizophila]|uniref:DUF4349 domain-containing protein n=1 Tax=Stenotrophomonas rhizophila TaxID=216778 RepID=UPI001E49FF54|nr:DUF4349 domain-containing protein [Stenotrophomonas rhizophila]MCC7635056.1 DUF4349 domain-containing protein [Stenotrophomonas rhizophila]MCC7662567.1 DUF4349 domain-containing protein [Stenotrophomonas rhizophila]